MSIFSVWEKGDFETLRAYLTGSQEGLILLALFAGVFIGIIFLMVHLISHQISGFYLHIQQDEERARREEEEEERIKKNEGLEGQ